MRQILQIFTEKTVIFIRIACRFKFSFAFFQRRRWHPTPVLLSEKSHGRRSLVGCSPWGREESDTTEQLHFHFSLSCIGEGNGNPLQCSCLENPRHRGAWWAAIYGVAQSWTWLTQLSSSSGCFLLLFSPTVIITSLSPFHIMEGKLCENRGFVALTAIFLEH